jgi:uncharacterized RDD family membrane protein YckC
MSQAARGAHEGAVRPERARIAAARVHEAPASPTTPAYEGLVTRTIAFAIDAALIDLIAVAVGAAIALAASVLGVPDEVRTSLVAVGGVAFVVWTILYFVVFWSTTGQTPGNRLLRIRVCRASDHAVLRPRKSLLRLAALTLAAIPLFAGFLPILVDNRRRGLHDMIAGTVVIGAEEESSAVSGRARSARS